MYMYKTPSKVSMYVCMNQYKKCTGTSMHVLREHCIVIIHTYEWHISN